MAQTYELYVTSKQPARKKCLDRLRKLSDSLRTIDKSPAWKDFFQIDLEVSGNIWDKARELAAIPGIIDVDPVEKIFGLFNEPTFKEDFNQDASWNHVNTSFPEAIAYAEAQNRFSKETSTKIKVAQLDTGYTEHPEINKVKKRLKGYNFIEKEKFDFAKDPMTRGFLEFSGHGSATASVFVGTDTHVVYDNMNGVFPYVDFYPYRVSNSVIHIMSDELPAAIRSAVDRKVDVIVMSLGGLPKISWQKAVEEAFDNGTILVAAAGNHVNLGLGDHSVVWPAQYNNVIAVAAVNYLNQPWEYSCYGSSVDISAPGENVRVADVQIGDNYLYTFGSGTSFAVPHVGAAAALWLHYYREELADKYFIQNKSEKVNAFRFALQQSATPVRFEGFGHGILNARRLLDFSPQDYLNTHTHRKFSLDFAVNFVPENNGPNLEQRELMSLVLMAELDDKAGDDIEVQLQQFVEQNASLKAQDFFQKLIRQSNSIREFMSRTPERLTTVAEVRGRYFSLLTNGW